jgi:hypothetical protein
LAGGDSSAWELTGALGPMALVREDDAARRGGSGSRVTATGGWHGSVGISIEKGRSGSKDGEWKGARGGESGRGFSTVVSARG